MKPAVSPADCSNTCTSVTSSVTVQRRQHSAARFSFTVMKSAAKRRCQVFSRRGVKRACPAVKGTSSAAARLAFVSAAVLSARARKGFLKTMRSLLLFVAASFVRAPVLLDSDGDDGQTGAAVRKFIDKCKKNYAKMTPRMQANVRGAWMKIALVPLFLILMGFQDGWRKMARFMIFGIVFFTVVIVIGYIAYGVQKLFGNGKFGEKAGTFVGVILFLAFFVALLALFIHAWGH